jgi:hypothetical protein
MNRAAAVDSLALCPANLASTATPEFSSNFLRQIGQRSRIAQYTLHACIVEHVFLLQILWCCAAGECRFHPNLLGGAAGWQPIALWGIVEAGLQGQMGKSLEIALSIHSLSGAIFR